LACAGTVSYGVSQFQYVLLIQLSLPRWITPSIFERLNGVSDEFSLGQKIDHRVGSKILQQHWDTWCTFADFKRIKDAGFNTVRIPIGYWAYQHANSDPYIGGAAKYIDAAVDWARILDLKIWICLHGSPGSQNGFDNSGRRGGVGWLQGKTADQTLSVIKIISDKYAKPDHSDVISGIEILNEPVCINLVTHVGLD
jgi:glucan 1,3-beta-glucosidase